MADEYPIPSREEIHNQIAAASGNPDDAYNAGVLAALKFAIGDAAAPTIVAAK